MDSSDSPFPRRTPVLRFRLSGPKQVPKVSPTPLRPVSVEGRAPRLRASRCISLQPRVTSAAMAVGCGCGRRLW